MNQYYLTNASSRSRSQYSSSDVEHRAPTSHPRSRFLRHGEFSSSTSSQRDHGSWDITQEMSPKEFYAQQSPQTSRSVVKEEEIVDFSQSIRGSQSASLDASFKSGRKRLVPCYKYYDPKIEIRQARERYLKNQRGEWEDTSFLFDATVEDKEKYRDKLEARAKEKGLFDKHGNPKIDMEENDEVLMQRQRDIDIGKVRPEYEAYVTAVPKHSRRPRQPRTPNKFMKHSRRAWDGLVRAWRRNLHTWEKDIESNWSINSSFNNRRGRMMTESGHRSQSGNSCRGNTTNMKRKASDAFQETRYSDNERFPHKKYKFPY